MFFLCRPDVEDVGSTVEKHWVDASCLLFSQVSVCRGPLSAAVTCVILRNIAIRPWLRYLSQKISNFVYIF